MPDHIIRKAVYAVASALRHLGKAFCFGLVLERVTREVDACVCQPVFSAEA